MHQCYDIHKRATTSWLKHYSQASPLSFDIRIGLNTVNFVSGIVGKFWKQCKHIPRDCLHIIGDYKGLHDSSIKRAFPFTIAAKQVSTCILSMTHHTCKASLKDKQVSTCILSMTHHTCSSSRLVSRTLLDFTTLATITSADLLVGYKSWIPSFTCSLTFT